MGKDQIKLVLLSLLHGQFRYMLARIVGIKSDGSWSSQIKVMNKQYTGKE